jgi:type IV pilus assembly protein PilB
MKPVVENIEAEVRQTVNSRQAWHYRIIPLKVKEGVLEVCMDQSRHVNGIGKELSVVLGLKVAITPVVKEVIDEALARYYPKTATRSSSPHVPGLIADRENYILTVIEEALSLGSSDIHFEVQEKGSRIRYRVDGNLVDRYTIPSKDYPAIVNAVKIKSNLDIAEKRLPQDGRIFFNRDGRKLDIRVSIIPTIHGEKVVFRLLNKDTSHIDLDKIGFEPGQLDQYKNGFLRSHGLVLISGPTGSGKTTTLYATLKRLNTSDRNILTIEDPIEYTLDGINQVQLKEGIGLTFPIALRTFLRQDPDIIMVGEIRDAETAQIAIRSALTGHLVLSTIHTNSAWGIISRLLDMGVPDYLISATLNVAVAQRLVRLLCPACKMATGRDETMAERFFPGWKGQAYKPAGCEKCNYSGFRGRKAIFEVIGIDRQTRDKIRQGGSARDQPAFQKDKTLAHQAGILFKRGETTLTEVLPILLNQ